MENAEIRWEKDQLGKIRPVWATRTRRPGVEQQAGGSAPTISGQSRPQAPESQGRVRLAGTYPKVNNEVEPGRRTSDVRGGMGQVSVEHTSTDKLVAQSPSA